jgi:hypothetical protein
VFPREFAKPSRTAATAQNVAGSLSLLGVASELFKLLISRVAELELIRPTTVPKLWLKLAKSAGPAFPGRPSITFFGRYRRLAFAGGHHDGIL